MQNNKFHYCLHILPILFFMAFVSASCIKDDLRGEKRCVSKFGRSENI